MPPTHKYMGLTYINHGGDLKIMSTTLSLAFPSPSETTFRLPNRTFPFMIFKILLFMVPFTTKLTETIFQGNIGIEGTSILHMLFQIIQWCLACKGF